MNRQEILDRLRTNERALRARGVIHAALFVLARAATTAPAATPTL